jgi:hypothetical protein
MRFSSAGIDPRPTELLALRDRALEASMQVVAGQSCEIIEIATS